MMEPGEWEPSNCVNESSHAAIYSPNIPSSKYHMPTLTTNTSRGTGEDDEVR